MRGVAVVSTLLNEAQSLPDFLNSLLAQTRSPQEIILVDGGSSDGSREIIQQYIDKGAGIQLLVLAGANRSRGRNAGIRQSRQPLIAMTDVGCRLEKDWLEKIVAPLERSEAEVASGYYLPEAKSLMARAIAAATVPGVKEIRPEEFLPSSRSVAFLKSAWEKSGGYPEWNSDGEDTLFDFALQKSGASFCVVPEALVNWRVQGNLRGLFRQFYRYARSDGAAGLMFAHYQKVSLLAAWTLLLVILMIWLPRAAGWPVALLAITAAGYGFRYVRRALRRGWDWPAALLAPVAMLVVDMANYLGHKVGRLGRKCP